MRDRTACREPDPQRKRVERTIRSVGRIELPNDPKRRPYGGTGFVVGKDLIMTNRHVAKIFTHGMGNRHLRFFGESAMDFLREEGKGAGPLLIVRDVVMIHPYWDMAILRVEGLPVERQPPKLSIKDARDMIGHDIFVVGYPGFDLRNPADVQNKLFNRTYGVKRMQPGELQGPGSVESFGKIVPAATHDCSTLGGNSGSALADLESDEVLALHFGGQYHDRNFAVPSACLAQDSRIIDAGVEFAGKAPGTGNDWVQWWTRADNEEADEADDPRTPGRGEPQNKGASAALTTRNVRSLSFG